MNAAYDFPIENRGVISDAFLSRGIRTFSEAGTYIKELPFRRNADKENPLVVLEDNCGTCSTKHSLLMRLIRENSVSGFELRQGIFKMNAVNSPSCADIFSESGLDYIPEAHMFLRYDGGILDFTQPDFGPDDFESDIMDEISIEPDQITTFKVGYHRNFLKSWIDENNIPYTLDELWIIRENCIAHF